MFEMGNTFSSELGVIPVNWQVKRFDSLFTVQQGKQVSKSTRIGGNQRIFLRTKNVFWGRLDLTNLDAMHFTEAEEKRLSLEPGDLLICEGGDIGRTAIWQGELARCYYQNHIHRARLRDESGDSRFVLYWLWYAFEVASIYFGRGNVTTIPNLSQSKLCELPLPLPPLPEQRKIADVLGLVQRAIEQQERLIQLTTELKKTLMHKIFTQGLQGEPQKETEIGPVPESWEIVPLSDGVSIKNGQVDPKVTPFREMIHVGPENIESHTGRLINLRSNGELRISSGNYHFTNDDILYSKIRPYLNKVALPDFEGTCSADMYPLRPKAGQFVRGCLFQLLLSDTFNKQAVSQQDRTGIPKVNRVQLGSILLPKPSLSEQVDIAGSLALFDQRIDQRLRKHVALSDLFLTLLHQLMTAQIRIHDLDFQEITATTI